MAYFRMLVTQGGNDTFTSAAKATSLTVDGKAGWSIRGIRAYWVDGAAVASADYSIQATVQVGSTVQTFADDEYIDGVAWGLQNTAGVAVAATFEPFKEHFLDEPRVTVQPNIYVSVSSSGTAQANDVIFEVHYDVVKLTDLEIMRLLAGGA